MPTETFPAPSRGWVQSGNIVLAGKDQAERLDNYIPTAQGARLRGGSSAYADLGAACVRLFNYASAGSETLFASTAADIFDASDVGSGAVKTSLTSGDWSTTQISTAGGQFLVGVNGADTGWSYNGSTFSDLSLTGVSPDVLSQVWLFKNRLFFVEGNTTSVWYLAVDSIGGTATEIDLGSVFAKGGSVLFGATWSLDSGSGLDDVCLFVTSEGEIAVYEGTDPSSANTWALVGVYEVGRPLNKHGWFGAGGDVAILTIDGIIPVSEALRKDRAALQANALTMPIEDAWRSAVANSTTSYPVSATLWQAGTFLLVGTPDTFNGLNVAFVANARTGAWARITGWDVRCAAVSGDDLYFGDNDGNVFRADTGGNDNGAQYTGTYVPKFTPSDRWRSANAVRLVYRANAELDVTLDVHADYQIDDMAPPASSVVPSGDTWGSGVWGTFIWGSTAEKRNYSRWQAAHDNGYSLAPSVQVTSNQTSALNFEIMATEINYEVGAVL